MKATHSSTVSAVLVAATILTGCSPVRDEPSREGEPATRSPSPTLSHITTPDADEVDFRSPQRVCDAFTDTLFSGSPATETQDQPARRATKYATPGYEKDFLSYAPRLAEWTAWGEAGAVQLEHTPQRYVGEAPDKQAGNRQYRVASRRVVPTDAAGEPVGRTYGFVVYCTLQWQQGGWLVDGHDQGEIDPDS